LLFGRIKTPRQAGERGLPNFLRKRFPGPFGSGKRVLSATSTARRLGIAMTVSLVWRTLLFVGLTTGYVVIAALPYLAS
jgi:hypothetical protein